MDENFYINQNEEIQNNTTEFWSEKIYAVTDDYEVKGYVFFPKTGRKDRVLSDILNGNKRFMAIKNAEIINRADPEKKVETCDFIQLNLDSIILLRPLKEN